MQECELQRLLQPVQPDLGYSLGWFQSLRLPSIQSESPLNLISLSPQFRLFKHLYWIVKIIFRFSYFNADYSVFGLTVPDYGGITGLPLSRTSMYISTHILYIYVYLNNVILMLLHCSWDDLLCRRVIDAGIFNTLNKSKLKISISSPFPWHYRFLLLMCWN
jgi:hypothetical protein